MFVPASDWELHQPWIDREECDIDGYVKSLASPPDYDLAEKLHHWREHGIVIFEQAVSHELIEVLKEDVAFLTEHPRGFELTVDLKGKQFPVNNLTTEELRTLDSLKFHNIHSISKAATVLSLNKCVCSFLKHVFQNSPSVLQSLLFNKGSQQPIHLDYPYVNYQTKISQMAASWIPLEDIHPDAGPLAYYCGSQRPSVVPFFDWGNGNIIMDESALKSPMDFSNYLYDQMKTKSISPKLFHPKKGDLLIWHAYLAHEGTKINNKALTRGSYVSHYTPVAAHPVAHIKPDAIAQGYCLHLNDGYAFDYPWVTSPSKLPSGDRIAADGSVPKSHGKSVWRNLMAYALR